jgi:hypothetical protein
MSTPVNNDSVHSPTQNQINATSAQNALSAQYVELASATGSTSSQVQAAAAAQGAKAASVPQGAQYVEKASTTATQVGQAAYQQNLQAQANINASILTSNISNLEQDKASVHARRNLANNVQKI